MKNIRGVAIETKDREMKDFMATVKRLFGYWRSLLRRFAVRWYRILWDCPANWHPDYWDELSEFYWSGKSADCDGCRILTKDK